MAGIERNSWRGRMEEKRRVFGGMSLETMTALGVEEGGGLAAEAG